MMDIFQRVVVLGLLLFTLFFFVLLLFVLIKYAGNFIDKYRKYTEQQREEFLYWARIPIILLFVLVVIPCGFIYAINFFKMVIIGNHTASAFRSAYPNYGWEQVSIFYGSIIDSIEGLYYRIFH